VTVPEIIRTGARRLKIAEELALALAWKESSFRPTARGDKGEWGLFQLMPKTARAVGFKGPFVQLLDPYVNTTFGLRHLRDCLDRYGGDVGKAVSAYNAGDATQANQPFVAEVLYYAARIGEMLTANRLTWGVAGALTAVAVVVMLTADGGG
jgi:soluble lytic murein transglycosylase-like protein